MRTDAPFRSPTHASSPSGPPFRGRGEGTRRFVWLLLLAGVLAAGSPRPAQAEITLDALVGFGQSATAAARYRPETWTPITVFLTGQGVRGVGQLTVTLRQGTHTFSYSRRVSLHEGPLNETQGFAFELKSEYSN